MLHVMKDWQRSILGSNGGMLKLSATEPGCGNHILSYHYHYHYHVYLSCPPLSAAHWLVRNSSNKPLEWTSRHQLSAAPPQAPCLQLRGGVREMGRRQKDGIVSV
jgi:hypothetical protein